MVSLWPPDMICLQDCPLRSLWSSDDLSHYCPDWMSELDLMKSSPTSADEGCRKQGDAREPEQGAGARRNRMKHDG